ncbi:MAG: TatD family hydrolase [Nanopusillaceae archaeon]
MIVDDHAHLFMYGEKADQKISENIEKGVKYIIENATDLESFNLVINESKKYDIVYYALGLYPDVIDNLDDKKIEETLYFIENNKDKKFVAIGEIGIDFYHPLDEEKKKKEIFYFEKFLELAEKLKKPAIIHSRKAEKEVLEIIQSYNVVKVLHTFWKPALAKKAIDLGCYLSIPAIAYRDDGFKKIIRDAPLDLILTETDAPFLDPLREGENNSWKIIYELNTISEIKKIDIEEVKKIIFNNFIKVYNISDE